MCDNRKKQEGQDGPVYRIPDYQTSFESTDLSVQEKTFNIAFQDGSHLGFSIRMILAAFDHCHLDTSNEVSSQLAFWFRIKKFKIEFQHGC